MHLIPTTSTNKVNQSRDAAQANAVGNSANSVLASDLKMVFTGHTTEHNDDSIQKESRPGSSDMRKITLGD